MYADVAAVTILSVVYRILNCFCVQTAFVPDEYWQSLEPAHRLVFGEGYLTWEWQRGIRSYLYPLVFAAVYKVLAVLHLDSLNWLFVMAPKLVQALLFGVTTDVFLYKLGIKLGGLNVARCTLVAYWLNWFQFFCAPRTLTNCVETCCVVVGLYFYKWPVWCLLQKTSPTKNSRYFLAIATISTVIRPTCAVFWAPLALWQLFRNTAVNVRYVYREKAATSSIGQLVSELMGLLIDWSFVMDAFIVCVPCLLFTVFVDYLCYGQWLFSMYRFAEFNVLEGGSAHFGSSPMLWYLLGGLPAVMFTHAYLVSLFFMYRHTYGRQRPAIVYILYLCVFYICVFSLLPHKEHRFLLPLVPLLCLPAGCWIEMGVIGVWPVRLVPSRRLTLIMLLVTNALLAMFTGVYHQRGGLAVARYLNKRFNDPSADHQSVLFAMPCHSVPLYSHIHPPVNKTTMRFLTCEPNLKHVENYVDEADRFYENPADFMRAEFKQLDTKQKQLPTLIVVYEGLWKNDTRFKHVLSDEYHYDAKYSFFHTYFPDGDRQSYYMLILER